MPIYEYKCDACESESELLLPFSKAGKPMVCDCGQPMRRKFSIVNFTMPLTGRDKVLNTLNNDNGFDFPGGDKHRKRYEQSFSQGLDPPKATIGVGF